MAEGQDATYTVVLDTAPVGDVTVTIGGVTGTDLSLDKTTLTFTTTDWDAAQAVTVTAGQDGDTADDTATLTHTVASAGDSDYDGVSAGSIAVTVTDDDSAGVTISEATLTIDEGDSAAYTVVLDTQPTGDVTVTISGHTGTDLSLDKTTLTFAAQDWDTAQTVTVTADEDDNTVDDEVTLTHTVASAADSDYQGAIADSVTVTITDAGVPTVTVSFEQSSHTVLEGSSISVKVKLDVEPERTVTIPITKAEQDGASSADYSGVPASLVFARGETEKSFTFAAATDDAVDDGESVKLGFGTPPARVSAGTPAEAVVSIDDTTRRTFIQRINLNGTANTSTTVAGEFKVRIHFNPSATGLAREDLEITNGTIDDFLDDTHSGFNVWNVDILPTQGASTVTVRVPPDVVDGGNQPAEVTYDAEEPLTVEFTTTANEPVVAAFQVKATFSTGVVDGTNAVGENVPWRFTPQEDLTITRGTYVSHREVSATVWTIIVQPRSGPGITVVSLPQGKVATGFDTGVWNAAASIELEAGRRSVSFEQARPTRSPRETASSSRWSWTPTR